MASPPSFPSNSEEVIRVYQGVRVRVRRNVPCSVMHTDSNYVPYRRATTFENDKSDIWQVIKQYQGYRDVFDALSGYKKLESHKDELLSELQLYYPKSYPVVKITEEMNESIDPVDDLIAAMPYLVLDHMKRCHRISMAASKSPVNSEIRYYSWLLIQKQKQPLSPSIIINMRSKRNAKRATNTDLKLKPNIRIALKNVAKLKFFRLSL